MALKTIVFIISMGLYISLCGQVLIMPCAKSSKCSDKAALGHLNYLKSESTTLYLPDELYKSNINNLESLKKSWTINDLEVQPLSKKQSIQHNDAVISFEIKNYSKGYTTISPYISLHSLVKKDLKKTFRFEMHATKYTGADINKVSKHTGAIGDLVYFNMTIGHMSNLLAYASKMLENNIYRDLYDEKISSSLARLNRDTLYIPNYIIEERLAKSNNSWQEAQVKIMGDYPFPYRIVTNVELSNLILDDQKEINYLIYILRAPHKFVSVWNSKNNYMLYSKYNSGKYNFTEADIKRLTNNINKALKKN